MNEQTRPSNQDIQAIARLFSEQRFAECEALARALVKRFADSGFGWKALAVSLNMQGEHGQGLTASQRAAELLPDDAEVHNNLGLTYKHLGQLGPAAVSLQRAMALKPGNAAGWHELAWVQHQLGELAEAETSYTRAVQLDPQRADAFNNLGVVQRMLGRLQDAQRSLAQAISIQPDHPDAHGNLGLVLHDQGQLVAAEASYRHALLLAPQSTAARINLGITLRELDRRPEAENLLREAIAIDPSSHEAQINLALVLQDQGLLTQAEEGHRAALALNPSSPEAHNNLGDVLRKMGRLEQAEAEYREALRLRPDWLMCQSNLLFALSYTASDPQRKALQAARDYGRMVSRLAGTPYAAWPQVRQTGPLRVGLVSGDLRSHPVGYFLEPLLAHADRTKIEFIAYSAHHLVDETSERLRPLFAEWRSLVGLDDEAAARLIHHDGVNVLVDLSGHTSFNRLPVFGRKPAPVQVGWLGYFGTTGVEQMDYVIADEAGVPEAGRSHFTEQVAYLPGSRLCLSAPTTRLEVAPLPALNNGFVTFACFQNLSKLNDDTLRLWARIFAALPKAQLSLRCGPLTDAVVRAELSERLQALGIDASRVAMQGGISRHLYLAMHANVDMILDTFPYPGGTTTCESLWMGVPTLTLAGETMLSRQGASLLGAAGLADWIATDAEDYVAKAVAHASDLGRLAALRLRLREQVRTSPLFDAQGFARHFESLMLRLSRAD